MKLSQAEVSLIMRKWNILIQETKASIKKTRDEAFWEKEFHETRLRRFIQKHAKGNEILEKNLMYLIVYTKLHKPHIKDVSLELLSLTREGNAQCLFCEQEPVVGYLWQPMPNNTEGRDIAFLFWVCDDHETKVQEYNMLITQLVDELYSRKKYGIDDVDNIVE